VAQEIRGTQEWTNKLSQIGSPVLAKVIAQLNKLADDDDSGVGQLSSVILRDATLTSQVLRSANSAMFNPRQKILEAKFFPGPERKSYLRICGVKLSRAIMKTSFP